MDAAAENDELPDADPLTSQDPTAARVAQQNGERESLGVSSGVLQVLPRNMPLSQVMVSLCHARGASPPDPAASRNAWPGSSESDDPNNRHDMLTFSCARTRTNCTCVTRLPTIVHSLLPECRYTALRVTGQLGVHPVAGNRHCAAERSFCRGTAGASRTGWPRAPLRARPH